MNATVLYTPPVLALATGLSAWPWDDELTIAAETRSRACGSTLKLGIDLDSEGRVARLGLRCQACAIGQAAAAIFAGAAEGRTLDAIVRDGEAIARWLAGSDEMPDWPGLEVIAPAAAYPGRHGAIMLPWNAAAALLPTA
ncbi:iron-sulfur cluster assembly scaffold protein [Novosphingobium aquimarinum]|uniref:iron-sulfur cluster assembly scaffold protein n=1 Tax=Novosphingobium aquimarinum TaxID=2682494 RepID=UPI0012EBEF07|nr:iron-sulfur cluster assembly scaffold protein [Novosphingobium aquimarinum]